MRSIGYFFQKELVEAWRRYRILLLALVFLMFGIASPLIAKITPELVKSTLKLSISLPTPSSVEAWQQFFKNITQIGIWILVVTVSGSISTELSRGTFVNLVTKGLPRYAIVVAKYLMALLQWWVAISLAFVTTWGYTVYYFPDQKTPHVLAGIVPLLIFGGCLMAITLFGSTISKGSFTGFLVSVMFFVSMMILNMVEDFHKWNPISLITDNLTIMQGNEKIGHLMPAMGITLALSVVFVGLAVVVLNRRKL
jgi:ABC-2 type transport system permease protein